MTGLSFTLPNLVKVASVMAVTSAPVFSLKITDWSLISMLTVQQDDERHNKFDNIIIQLVIGLVSGVHSKLTISSQIPGNACITTYNNN